VNILILVWRYHLFTVQNDQSIKVAVVLLVQLIMMTLCRLLLMPLPHAVVVVPPQLSSKS
jgi:hypothetical protein